MSEKSKYGVKEKGKLDALLAFENDQRMYKKNDYRCLKPSNKTKPEQWAYYDMKGFRAAKTEHELEKVKEINLQLEHKPAKKK